MFGVRFGAMHADVRRIASNSKKAVARVGSMLLALAEGTIFRPVSSRDLACGIRWLPLSIDQTCYEAGAKSIVDVYDRHIRRTRIEHTKQRGDPSKRCTVTNAGWHCHYRHTDKAPDN